MAQLAGRVGVAQARAQHAEEEPSGERAACADVRGQRAHDAVVDGRGAAGSSVRSAGADLLGVGHALLGLLARARALVERAQQQVGAELLQARRERAVGVVGARSARGPRGRPGRVSRPAVRRMMRRRSRSSPAMIARSTGAAPRQRGSSDGWTLRSSCSESSGSLMQRAEGADDHDVGLRRGDPRAGLVGVDVLGLVELEARARAPRRRPAARASLRPRPSGRSGRVTTSAGRCGLSARRLSTAAAKSDVPR